MNAVINVRKEKDWTSQDVCSKLKGILHEKKIGHTGTLDPNAQGVLPICVGKATKLCSMITDWTKTYEAECILGLTSDSYDITGNILSKNEVNVSTEKLKAVVSEFVGSYDQYPPIFSARKVNGKKLYEYARSGQDVTISPKKITVYSIDITRIEMPKIYLRIKCSKGTYVRSICHDIGKALGCGAVMGDLIRTDVGPFNLSTSYSLETLQKLKDENRLDEAIIKIDTIFKDIPEAYVEKSMNKYVYNGNAIDTDRLICNNLKTLIRLYDSEGQFIGIYEKGADLRSYKPKLFVYDPSAPLR